MTETIVLSFLFIVPALIVIVRNTLWDMYFWQIKEYRVDRFITHFLWDQLEENRNRWVTAFKFICFAGISLMFTEPIVAIGAIFLIYFLWLYEALDVFAMLFGKRLKRPSLKSPRNLLMMFIAVFTISIGLIVIIAPFAEMEREIEGGTAVLSDFAITLNNDNGNTEVIYPDTFILIGLLGCFGLLLDVASPFFSAIYVFLTAPFAEIRRDITLSKARRKYLLELKHNLKIIGITGSQGKTTTKEILYALIKDSFNTVKTPENYNTDFGVATTLLKKVEKETDIFVAEMGAYKRYEIKRICQHFPPDISIITDIDTQHLGLFGTIEKLIDAKTEIVTYMKDGGTAIINGDNEKSLVVTKFHDGDIHIVTTSSDSNQFKAENQIEDNAKIFIHNAIDISETKGNLTFTYINGDIKEKIETPMKGKHLVYNVMFAIVAAKLLGIPLKEIKKVLKNLPISLPRLSVDTGDNNTVILNDSYNSSPKGFEAAVQVMNEIFNNTYPDISRIDAKVGRRIILTKGIYELGKHKRGIYKKLLTNLKGSFDILITTDGVLAKAALHENTNVQIIKIRNHAEMVFETRKLLEPNDIILLEGKVHPEVMKTLISDFH